MVSVSMTKNDYLQDLLAFIQNKGFIWGPEPEIYNGLSGFYTYGPLGKLLKNNVVETIKHIFLREGFFEVECPIIQPKKVWEASGHLGGFTDPVIFTKKGSSFRVDNMIEEYFRDNNQEPPQLEGLKSEEYIKIIKENNIKAPNGEELDLDRGIESHNLMMETKVGMNLEAFNRPETATTTYLPFPRYNEFFRGKFPFGVFQIGKAFRNEISPRQHVIRCREFEQAEAQVFIHPDDKNNFERYDTIKDVELPIWSWKGQSNNLQCSLITVEDCMKRGFFKSKAYAWTVYIAYNLFRKFGIPFDRIRLRQHGPDEKAFYADDAWDVEIELKSFGWIEVCGIHDRTDYDLKQHEKFSGKKLEGMTAEGKKFRPHILEIAFGTDRPTFALLDIYYDKKEKEQGKTIFAIPSHIAPLKVAVFPLMKKPELQKVAKEIYDDLMKSFVCFFDEAGSIGRRYLRAAEFGIPYCITIDYDSVEKGDVTIRDRDSEEQKRVKITDLKEKLTKLIDDELSFEQL